MQSTNFLYLPPSVRPLIIFVTETMFDAEKVFITFLTSFFYSLAIRGRLIIIGYITSYENDRGFIPSKVSATLPARVCKYLMSFVVKET